jgi:DNA-binding transcriptional ArsR family regulator
MAESSSRSNEEALFRARKEKQQTEEELLHVRRELDDVNREKERLDRSLRNLRQQLSPLHRALRAVFGEIELAVGEEELSMAAATGAAPQAQGNDARWKSYKDNFPGAPARMIDALLTHREMNITQLSKLLKMDYSTAKAAASKLRQAGAITGERGGPVRLNS